MSGLDRGEAMISEWLDIGIKFGTMLGVFVGIFISLRNSFKIAHVEGNVLLIEKATNSMKDALVASTGNAAHAAGKEEGRLEGEAKAAVLAQGQLKKEPTP